MQLIFNWRSIVYLQTSCNWKSGKSFRLAANGSHPVSNCSFKDWMGIRAQPDSVCCVLPALVAGVTQAKRKIYGFPARQKVAWPDRARLGSNRVAIFDRAYRFQEIAASFFVYGSMRQTADLETARLFKSQRNFLNRIVTPPKYSLWKTCEYCVE